MISFGFYNAPASFQGYINKILAEKLDICIIVYPNDIFIFIKSQVKPTLMPFNKFSKNWGKMAFLPISRSLNFIKTKFAF